VFLDHNFAMHRFDVIVIKSDVAVGITTKSDFLVVNGINADDLLSEISHEAQTAICPHFSGIHGGERINAWMVDVVQEFKSLIELFGELYIDATELT